jgi:ectoine hydroxylase-related dioxygenase (phytanoyl-CoA dioxygenase family)
MSTEPCDRTTLSPQQRELFESDGYVIVRKLFSVDELLPLADHFDRLAREGAVFENHWHPDPSAEDPLERFPRVYQAHRFHDLSRQILLDRRLRRVLQQLYGEEPLAAQSMFYFKPPGARGQALHQDNRALQAKPTTCMAAWIAIDPATPDNGGLFVVPGSHTMELICPHLADRKVSGTAHALDVPEGMEMVPASLDPGDVLFFNGSLIHGSRPNEHPTLWRRAYILHYVAKSTRTGGADRNPLLDFDGNEINIGVTEGGGPCGGEYLPLELQNKQSGY